MSRVGGFRLALTWLTVARSFEPPAHDHDGRPSAAAPRVLSHPVTLDTANVLSPRRGVQRQRCARPSVVRSWYAWAVFGEVAWDEASEAHVARHAITPDEVEDVFVLQTPLGAGRSAWHDVCDGHDPGRPVLVRGRRRSGPGRSSRGDSQGDDRGRAAAVPSESEMTMSGKYRAGELAEVAEHVEGHDMAGVVDTAVWDTDVVPAPMVVTSIRLPRPLMQRVRAQADAAGVPATTLMRTWVEDRLVAQELGNVDRDQLVAALRAVLADLDPLRAHLADSV